MFATTLRELGPGQLGMYIAYIYIYIHIHTYINYIDVCVCVCKVSPGFGGVEVGSDTSGFRGLGFLKNSVEAWQNR